MAGFESLSGAHGRPVLRRGLRVDHLGDERLVLDPASGVVHTVRGAAVKALDAIVAGRVHGDAGPVAALVGAGIVTGPGVSRREAISLASGAAVLISTFVLPNAVAAASVAGLSFSGDGGILRTFLMQDGSSIYSLTHETNVSGSVVRSLVFGASSRRVELVLVGGGGAGGPSDSIEEGNLIYAGGGGGGEVRYVDLGTVAPSTSFELSVAGRSGAGSGGNSTQVTNLSTSTVVATAVGGGVGGGFGTPVGSGGSGGGGYNVTSAAGVSSIRDVDASRFGSDGAAGATGTSGGGGGAGYVAEESSTHPTTGSSSTGGRGGAAKPLSDFFSLTVADGQSAVTGELNLGAGGGGAGVDAGGDGGLGAGAGGRINNDGDAVAGGAGNAGSGGGGGGGISRVSATGAGPGRGATGAIWVRVSAP